MQEGVAIVTGSGRGIGRAIALELAREGFRVAVNDLYSNGPAEETLAQIVAAGGEGMVVGADISDPQAVRIMVDQVVDHFGRVDVLVNNAGINNDQLLIRISDEEWDQLIRTNLNGAFYCSRAAIKHMMRKRYGRIIHISSVVGIAGNAGQAHYAAAKSGLLGFSRSIAREYGNRNITSNVIAPGYIASDMTAALNAEQRDKILSGVALGRLGTPEDIAGVTAFLASPRAAYITGQVIQVDGGLAM
ncbi:MAG: 3-oxoacyl-[acyl-carrier-protein] reductase [Syntrophomonadaceae bacterium]|nr:3-oxoacyl-[acyl-carrier-protein] reductase [Syntrophomonadaceae bacterium]